MSKGPCSFPGCGRQIYCSGLCDSHRKQRSAGAPLRPLQTTKVPNLIGQRFVRLTVVERRGSQNLKAVWLCRCDCGVETLVTTGALRSGNSWSCGCYSREISAETGRRTIKIAQQFRDKATAARTIHGATAGGRCSSEYQAWRNMISRCTHPSTAGFKNYGGRGISVCAEWRESFMAFLIWLGPKPTPAHTIERINNDGNYEPGNVRWATRKEQAQNRRPGSRQTPAGLVEKILALRGHFRAPSIAEALGVRPGLVNETWQREAAL